MKPWSQTVRAATSDQVQLWLLVGAAVACLALVAPHYVYPVTLMKGLCFALFACAFNLMLGYVGYLSFGHAAFFGMGSYVSAYLSKTYGLTPEVGILAGAAAGAFLGLGFALVAIRRHGVFFAMITLALAQVVYFLCLQMDFTGGEEGIQAVPRGYLFGIIDLRDNIRMYYFVLLVFLLGFVVIYRFIFSPFGQVLEAIRDNEQRAMSLGYEINRFKIIVFTVSAALSGLAGATKSLVVGVASLADVHWSMSGEVVLMTLIGGLGTMTGPIVGAFILEAMHTYLGSFGAWVTIIQGAIFMLVVLTFRAGIVGLLKSNARS